VEHLGEEGGVSNKDGPTRAQLLRRVNQLQSQLDRYKRGDYLRREGEHWYELAEFFDGDKITRIPAPFDGPTFMMGMLADLYVVEVPESASMEQVHQFRGALAQHGLAPALVVRKGVRFLKLATVPEDMEKRLDDAEVQDAQGKTPTGDAGAEPLQVHDADTGPELHGDGVGSDRSGEGDPDRGRSHSDREGEALGAPDGG
jgi:hypothetical protein